MKTKRTCRLSVEPETRRAEVRAKYRDVALDPDGPYRFHTGRRLAESLGYSEAILDRLPDDAVAAFAGVGNPFAAGTVTAGARVVDLGCGGGFDCCVASRLVGPTGHVVGVEMTPEMLARSRCVADQIGATNLEFWDGILEELPVPDGWADIVISNGALNLVVDKPRALAEARRILDQNGQLQVADVAAGVEIPDQVRGDVELWTDCIAGGQSVDEWCDLIADAGFEDISVGLGTDTFGGALGEGDARRFKVRGHTFRAHAV